VLDVGGDRRFRLGCREMESPFLCGHRRIEVVRVEVGVANLMAGERQTGEGACANLGGERIGERVT
jgi:hypothetical protein